MSDPHRQGAAEPRDIRPDEAEARALEEKFAGGLAAVALFSLSAFHYYTAGFGLMREVTHRAIHMSFVLALIFLVFAARRADDRLHRSSLWRPA